MKKGFTLIEVLAIIVIIGIIAVVVAPVINSGIKTNSENALEIQKERIIDAARDWSLEHLGMLPENDGEKINVRLSELKKGYLPINVKNPDTGQILSNESYVVIANNKDDYTYEAFIYDIPNEVADDLPVQVEGNFNDETISVGSSLTNDNISIGNNLTYSKQYILDNNEISKIDTTKKATYSVVYTFIYDNKIYKRVKTITVN